MADSLVDAALVQRRAEAAVRLASAWSVGDAAAMREAVVAFEPPYEPVADLLVRNQLDVAVLSALEVGGIEDARAAWARPYVERRRRRPSLDPRLALAALDEAQAELQARGIQVLVFKGPSLSVRLYGTIAHRPFRDLDLLVPRASLRPAIRILRAIGYSRRRRDEHARELVRESVQIDLHWTLRGAAPYRITESAVWRNAHAVNLDGVRVRTLSDEYLVTLMAIELAEDLGFGTAPLRSLCDLWGLARDVDSHMDWPGWLARRRREGVEPVVRGALDVMLLALGGAASVPRLHGALQVDPVVQTVERAQVLQMLAARPHSPANAHWFAGVYPGSMLAYRLRSLAAGLPYSLQDIQWRRFIGEVRQAASRRRE
jgi:hypothetical protein